MDAGEEQQQRWQEAYTLWALFAVSAGVDEQAELAAVVVLVVVAVKCQLTALFARFGY